MSGQLRRFVMRVDLLTREYPPAIYGGAGVHVTELARVLRDQAEVHVHCFDGPRPDRGVHGYLDAAAHHDSVLSTFAVDLAMVDGIGQADAAHPPQLVHSHTWYANLAGHLAGLRYDVPHILTAHSLEPLRPWKAEQLGGGYALSSWAEETAYRSAQKIIAVSAGMRQDILRMYPFVDPDKVAVVHNGIDSVRWSRPVGDQMQTADDVVRSFGIDPNRPTVVFVGRITRQKGLPYFLRAARKLDPEVQVVLCAGAPDTAEIHAEVVSLVQDLASERTGVVWIEQMLPRDELIAVLSAATVFACPSIYEPLGIVNLEAMALGLPVVGTATGGIPEVVLDGETGLLVPIDQAQDGTGVPSRPEEFIADLAAGLNESLSDLDRAKKWGYAGRQRVEAAFSWEAIGSQTLAIYEDCL